MPAGQNSDTSNRRFESDLPPGRDARLCISFFHPKRFRDTISDPNAKNRKEEAPKRTLGLDHKSIIN